MEASVAAGEAQGGEAEGAQGAAGAEQQQGGFDMDALKDHMSQELDRRFDDFSQQFSPQGGEGEGEGAEGEQQQGELSDEDLARLEQQLYGPDGEIDPEAAQQFMDGLVNKQAQSMIEPAVQKAVAPVMEALDDLRLANDSRSIVEQHPRMAEEPFARGVMERAAQTAQALPIGDEEAAKLVVSPAFIDLQIKALEAEQGAAGTPAGEGREAELESGGGSVGGAESTSTEAREIVQAGKKNSIWM